MVTRHRSPEIRAAVSADAGEVRRFIEQNLLYGRASLDYDPTGTAWQSLFQALYVAGIAAESEGQQDLLRIIDGASGPLDAIKARIEARCETVILEAESMTLRAVTEKVLEAIEEMPDATLVLAHQLMEQAKRKQAKS
jgi:hypothetical protein